MKTIKAKFNSNCAKTGEKIKKGELINYDPSTKKAYKLGVETEQQKEENPDSWIDDFLIDNYYNL